MAQNLKINITAKDKTQQAFSGVRGKLKGLKDSIFSVQGALVALGGGLAIRSIIGTGRQIEDLNVINVKEAIEITCFAGFLIAQESTRRMLKLGKGSIFFTGASASKKGFAKSSAFAMGKFGLRGLAQSLARELQPRNIHIAHFIIDGIIKDKSLSLNTNDNQLDPDEIAKNYLNVFLQEKNCWSSEIELRPWQENF